MLRLNNSILLLGKYDPVSIEALIVKYPGESSCLRGEEKLGGVTTTREPDEIDTKNFQVEMEVILESLEQVKKRILPNMAKLKERMVRSKKLKLTSSAISALTSAGLIGAVLSKMGYFVILANAGLAFISSIFTLLANDLELPSIGGMRNVTEIWFRLNDLYIDAEKVTYQLNKYHRIHEYGPTTLPLIDKGEEIVFELLKIERTN